MSLRLIKPARHACPAGYNALLALISFSWFLMIPWRPIISGSTGPIFTKFSPNGRYLVVDYWFNLLFWSVKRCCYRNQFYGKTAKSAYSPSFVALPFQNGLEYRNADRRVNSANDLATSCENLVNIGPVTLEFTMVAGVYPSSISSGVSLAMFAWQRHC